MAAKSTGRVMAREIQIRPGMFVEVSDRVRARAGLRPDARISATLASTAMYVAHDSMTERSGYPVILIDEAVELTRLYGPSEAVRVAGVPLRIIINRMHERGMSMAFFGKVRLRYPLEKMRECVLEAKKLMASDETVTTQKRSRFGKIVPFTRRKWSHRAAFAEAGRRVGVSGTAVERAWLTSRFSLTSIPAAPVPIPVRPSSPVLPPRPQGPPTIYEMSTMIGQECVRLRGLSDAVRPLVRKRVPAHNADKPRKKRAAPAPPPTPRTPAPVADSSTSAPAKPPPRPRKPRERRLLLWSTKGNGWSRTARLRRPGSRSAGSFWRETTRRPQAAL